MEKSATPQLEFFKSQIGKTLDQTPSAAGNWLRGILLEVDHHHIKVQYTVRQDMSNPGKILHGGIASLMLDDVTVVSVEPNRFEVGPHPDKIEF